MLATLRKRTFTLLWVGQLISVFGDWMLLIALPFYIFDLTGSALATGAMFIAQTVPRVLLGSVAGVFVDRWDRKRTMIAADLSRGAIILALLSVHSASWLWLIYLVAFVQAVIAQFFTPAKNAVVPLLVGESDLVAANSLNSLSENLTRLTAPALGSILYGLLGLASVVWIDCASFLTSGVLIALIAFPARPEQVEAVAADRSWVTTVQEWRDGMRLMRNDPTIAAIFATAGTAMIGEGFILVLLVPFVTDVLHSGPQGFGWLISAQAIGGFVGSALFGRMSRAVRPSLLIPLCGAPFGLLDIALANLPGRGGLPPLPVALVIFCLAGAPLIGFYIGIRTVLQSSAPDRFRGRVFGAYATMVAFATLVGQGAGSLIGDRFGVVSGFTLAGIFELLAALVAFILLGRAHRAAGIVEMTTPPKEAIPTA